MSYISCAPCAWPRESSRARVSSNMQKVLHRTPKHERTSMSEMLVSDATDMYLVRVSAGDRRRAGARWSGSSRGGHAHAHRCAVAAHRLAANPTATRPRQQLIRMKSRSFSADDGSGLRQSSPSGAASIVRSWYVTSNWERDPPSQSALRVSMRKGCR